MKIKFVTYGYLVLLLLVTLVPLGPLSTNLNDNYTLNIRWDYLLHAMVYLPLPVLMWLLLKKGGTGRFWLWVVIFPLIIASSFEVLQLLVPYRRFNINDLFANCMGVIIGLVLLPLLKKIITRLKWD